MKKTSAWLLATVVLLGCGRNTPRQGEGAFLAVKGIDNVGGGVRLEETPPGAIRRLDSIPEPKLSELRIAA